MPALHHVLFTLVVFAIVRLRAQEGGLVYHDFKTYKTDQVPEAATDKDQQEEQQQKYEQYNSQYDQTAHGDPEIAVLDGHSQGWSEYLQGLFNIQSLEFMAAESYPKSQ